MAIYITYIFKEFYITIKKPPACNSKKQIKSIFLKKPSFLQRLSNVMNFAKANEQEATVAYSKARGTFKLSN